MAAFDDVSLEWQGTRYTIPHNRVLRTIASIEDVITLGGLARNSRELQPGKISLAFGIMLRAAGADVTDEDVYDGMFVSDGGEFELLQRASEAVILLLAMMLPNSAKAKAAADGAVENPTPSPTTASSSSRSTKRSSAKVG
jgi:hypothetical protein